MKHECQHVEAGACPRCVNPMGIHETPETTSRGPKRRERTNSAPSTNALLKALWKLNGSPRPIFANPLYQ